MSGRVLDSLGRIVPVTSADPSVADPVLDSTEDTGAVSGPYTPAPDVPAGSLVGKARGFFGKVGLVLGLWIACVARSVLTPSLWIVVLPGRWLAFLAANVKVESGWGAALVNPTSGASGYLQWLPSSWQEFGVTVGSVLSEGWAVPAHQSARIGSMSEWFRLWIPGGTALRALWHYGSASSASCDQVKTDAEDGYASTYWWVRAVGLVIDVPILFGIACLGALLFRKIRGGRRA